MDHTHGIVKTRGQIKDELINTQEKQHWWLSTAVSALIVEQLAERLMHDRNSLKSPVIFASSLVAIGGLLGDLYHGAHRHKLIAELNSSTSLHNSF